jgi:purine-binding chemotaxis protein CheW
LEISLQIVITLDCGDVSKKEERGGQTTAGAVIIHFKITEGGLVLEEYLVNDGAEAAAGEEDALRGRFLTFIIGSETYGIQIRYVTEIIGMQAFTEMPEMPDYVKGLINLRGKIIPLIDVRTRFKKEARADDDRTCIIVVDLNGKSMGLIVDSVSEVLTIPVENIEELAELHAGQSNKYITRVGKIGDTVILLLDSEKLISDDDMALIGEAS